MYALEVNKGFCLLRYFTLFVALLFVRSPLKVKGRQYLYLSVPRAYDYYMWWPSKKNPNTPAHAAR